MSDRATLVEEASANGNGVVGYQPESPFVIDGYGLAAPAAVKESEGGSAFELESPFLSEYGIVGEDRLGPEAEAFAGLMGELRDEEFDEAVADLVNEASAIAEAEFTQEAEPSRQRVVAERGLRDYFEPLIRESETMVERMGEGIGRTDVATLTEAELEALLDRFAPVDTDLPPVFNQFMGKFFKKAKNALKGAASLAKKGIALANKLNPVHLALERLKKLARPLLERVLKVAINKLPVAIRPVAQQLAKKFIGLAIPTGGIPAPAGEQAAVDPGEIAEEFDVRLAGGILGGEAFAQQEAMEEFAESEAEGADALQELEHRRRRFARKVSRLRPGEDPAPVVEEFVPAVLGALKLGIGIIGRPRVVNFLAGLVANLIKKYVGQQQATSLSRALVDAGLRLVSLEAEAEAEDEAGHTLASVVEETVTEVVQIAPESAWESEAVLDGYVREAFSSAASAHFPDSMIRPELHEAAGTSGVWVPLPQGRPAKHYKKYSRVLEISISPQVAAAIKTFGGGSLQSVLSAQLGAALNQPVTARVHLYQALAGSTLSDISMHEKGVPGLGSIRPESWSQIHPLTPEAAGLLLKEPGLGRNVDPRFLVDRKLIDVRQRFYYLEFPGQGRPKVRRRPSRTRLALNFPKGELRVLLYYAESDAQALAAKLRAKASLPALLAALKAGLETQLSTILSGNPTKSVRVVHEAVPTEQLAAPVASAIFRASGRGLSQVLIKWLLEAFKREVEQRYDGFAGKVTAAANADVDGLTIAVVFQRPALLQRLRKMFAAGPLAALNLPALGLKQEGLANYNLTVTPGYASW